MSSNSATALATQQSIKAYVDSQVATADTLSEVLANGNTTGGTDIAVGTGDDITFADSSKAIFGAGSDLQIYHHSGGNSIIAETGTGDLFIQATNIQLEDASGNNMIVANSGGAVNLYHNAGEKLATTSTGIDVTGTVTADGLTVDTTLATIGSGGAINQATELRLEGTSNASNGAYLRGRRGGSSSFLIGDTAGALGSGTGVINYVYGSNPWTVYTNGNERLNIASNGDISFYEDTGTTAKLFWDASTERLGIGTTSPAVPLDVNGDIYARSGAIFADEFKAYSGSLSTYGSNTSALHYFKGNVGIGTSSPANPTVAGTVRNCNNLGCRTIDIKSQN